MADKDTILNLALEYYKAYQITQSRVNSLEFWDRADEADVDEIDLEEILARIDLFAAIENYMKELGK